MIPRRFLVVVALMFWLGGFTFYAAVVVPVGQEVLGSHLDQGFITRRVTNFLNLAGAAALLPLGWDVWACRDAVSSRRRGRWLSWWGMVGLLLGLVVLHDRLESLLDVDAHHIVERSAFRFHHRAYLWLSTFQWGLGVAYLWLSLRSWREADVGEKKDQARAGA